MKKVAILSNYTDSFITPPLGRLFSYQELTRVFKEHDIELVRVSIYSYDHTTGTFSDYVDFNADGVLQVFQESYTPDIIWNRSEDGLLYAYTLLQEAGYLIFPSTHLVTIANDKYEMSLFLEQHQPKTQLLKMFFADEKLRDNFPNNLVLKPIRANSGKGIEFFTKAELLEKREMYEGLSSVYIVQEFKDFSKGFPGLTNCMHDIRLVYIGGEFSHATLRTPGDGSLKSNVGSGGSQVYLRKDLLPDELLKLSDRVIKDLRIGDDSILSIDFGYVLDENRWYVFEINDSPGVSISPAQDGSDLGPVNTYFVNIARYFQGVL